MIVNHWAFVLSAYALTFLGTAVVSIASWRAMRAAEEEAQQMSERS